MAKSRRWRWKISSPQSILKINGDVLLQEHRHLFFIRNNVVLNQDKYLIDNILQNVFPKKTGHIWPLFTYIFLIVFVQVNNVTPAALLEVYVKVSVLPLMVPSPVVVAPCKIVLSNVALLPSTVATAFWPESPKLEMIILEMSVVDAVMLLA